MLVQGKFKRFYVYYGIFFVVERERKGKVPCNVSLYQQKVVGEGIYARIIRIH